MELLNLNNIDDFSASTVTNEDHIITIAPEYCQCECHNISSNLLTLLSLQEDYAQCRLCGQRFERFPAPSHLEYHCLSCRQKIKFSTIDLQGILQFDSSCMLVQGASKSVLLVSADSGKSAMDSDFEIGQSDGCSNITDAENVTTSKVMSEVGIDSSNTTPKLLVTDIRSLKEPKLEPMEIKPEICHMDVDSDYQADDGSQVQEILSCIKEEKLDDQKPSVFQALSEELKPKVEVHKNLNNRQVDELKYISDSGEDSLMTKDNCFSWIIDQGPAEKEKCFSMKSDNDDDQKNQSCYITSTEEDRFLVTQHLSASMMAYERMKNEKDVAKGSYKLTNAADIEKCINCGMWAVVKCSKCGLLTSRGQETSKNFNPCVSIEKDKNDDNVPYPHVNSLVNNDHWRSVGGAFYGDIREANVMLHDIALQSAFIMRKEARGGLKHVKVKIKIKYKKCKM